MSKLYLFMALAVFGFIACGDSAGSEAKEGEGMEQFADDEEFKNEHEEPATIAYDPQGTEITFATPDGKTGKAYYRAAGETSEKYLFVIHEWWGLNDHIRQEADRLFSELDDVHVMALDLYDGNVADNRDDAAKFMNAVQEERLNSIVKGALAQAGESAKVATIGWCFGGGWSLRSAILAEDQAAGCVIYYGMPVDKAAQLAPLKSDILGIFASQEKWINETVVNDFEALCAATGKQIEVHWFDADHAFANPSQPSYVEEAAQKANALALDYLKKRL